MGDFIKWIRSKVGQDTIILNFSGACITNEKGEVLQFSSTTCRCFKRLFQK